MYRGLSRKRRFGFTLVEVLVTTVVVGVMAAVVIPAVVKQATAGDPVRVASDLGSVKSAIETFATNVRPRLPGDIEDLINSISSTAERGLDGTLYSAVNVTKWKGPYLEWATTIAGDVAETEEIFKSGGNAILRNALYRCPTSDLLTPYSGTSTTAIAPCTFGTGGTTGNVTDSYVAVRLEGITVASEEFKSLNAIIDGVDEGTTNAHKQDRGLLRQNASGTIFFLAVPFVSP